MQFLDPNEFTTKRKAKIERYASLCMNKLVFSTKVTNPLLEDAKGKNEEIKLGITDTGEILFKVEKGGFNYRLQRNSRSAQAVIYNRQLCAFLREKYGFPDKTVKMLVSPEKDDNGFYTIIPRTIN